MKTIKPLHCQKKNIGAILAKWFELTRGTERFLNLNFTPTPAPQPPLKSDHPVPLKVHLPRVWCRPKFTFGPFDPVDNLPSRLHCASLIANRQDTIARKASRSF